MHSSATFALLRYYTAAVMMLPLLPGSAAAASLTGNPHAAKHQALKASQLPTTLPALATIATPATVQAAAPSEAIAGPTAPQTIQVTGIVLAPDGRPCAGASVYPAGAPRQLVVTDAQGAFTLPVPAGTAVSLRVEYFGEGSSRVDVPTPGSAPLRITLGK
jgi:hypothetical protein